VMSRFTGLTVADLAGLGVRRISVGGALARVAWTAFTKAAQTIARDGVFTGFEGTLSGPEINGLFTR